MKITIFDVYANLLKEKSGLALTPDKAYLLESRLSPIAKKWNHASVEAMGAALELSSNPAIVNEIIEAMTTNETFFFRDTKPFDLFKNVIMPHMAEARTSQRKFRVWSAASSSGQEPYSIAMLLKEAGMPWSGWDIDILGTDISNDILDTARKANYSQFEVQRGLPITLLMNYFTQEGERWQLKDEIKQMVQYQNFNLLDSPQRFGVFDVIFCRNVLIYFDGPTKTEIFARLAKQLAPDGYLFLGGAESVMGHTEEFKLLPGHRGLYVRADSPLLQQAA